MEVSKMSAVERIARVLAGQNLSANAAGAEPSAAPDVDDAWPDYEPDAIAVLKTLREPDAAMAQAGDPAIWERMIAAALSHHASWDPAVTRSKDAGYEAPEPGTDPLHEGP
ncbi:MAG TPA: hypothetical protein VL918_01475 [Sphingobium sp.]|nr:hypothetical protein [Sphingobium sp.]